MQETLTILVPIVLAHICVLIVIVFIIRRLLLSDTMEAVNRIRQVESEVRKKEEGIRQEIAEHEKEFERRRTESEEALQRRREESEREVAALREQALTDAKKEGDAIIAQARRNEARLREQLVRDAEEQAVELGTKIVDLVFSEKMTESLNRQFTDELLDALQQVDSASITIDAGSSEFVASRPIEPRQKERLRSIVSEKFGVEAEINETVDASLLAGLKLKLGSLEIDGSLKNRLGEAAAELKKEINA